MSEHLISSHTNQRWEQILRYRYIELIALWEGKLTTRQLCETFGIGRQQANKDLSSYRRALTQGDLIYDATAKHYLPSSNFKPILTQGLASEYLQLAAQQSDVQRILGHLPVAAAAVEVVSAPSRELPPSLLRPIIQAITDCRRIDVDYVSLNNPDREGRIVVPHTLVWTGYRWHVRAWCEKNQDFRDFVLSRFRGEADLMDSSERNASEDNDWQQRVTLQVEPDPRLRADQREVIAHDYNMENGRLSLTTRAKLAPYLLQLLNVNTGPLLDDPRAQQLVLSNHESLQNWLM
ncbi:WYL domain-containing protein [Luminiphilus sp.]|nr:WYL domain-containing protein [Luminiphilus sp.]MDA8739056.1 WYL domain-containing protein [Luminiphilus sp.]MDA8946826.1 WYL domain-containing protein [Luminiphilus sp.]MDB2312685.1 WYL domain-containing protein [Luminiphilus sp.]MDB2316834.1 WYL domain-containing protein [Luminiphilus sp.]